MASTEPRSLRAEILERTHILKDILDHVDDFAEEFNKVDYSALKDDILKPVLAETFDPETQIRGFLRTFKHTSAYKSAFSKIANQDLKAQIDAFVEGKHVKDVVKGHDLHLTAHKSPPVEHHFSLLRQLKKLVLCCSDVKDAVEDVDHPQHKHVKKLPILYENSSGTQVVEVGFYCRSVVITLTRSSVTAKSHSKTGV
jgi:hypothetical protein